MLFLVVVVVVVAASIFFLPTEKISSRSCNNESRFRLHGHFPFVPTTAVVHKAVGGHSHVQW